MIAFSPGITFVINRGRLLEMNIKLQQTLLNRYPKFLRKSEDARAFDERGFECEDGWFKIIDELCSVCEAEIDTLTTRGFDKSQWPRVAQIKEKLGSLRFRATGVVSGELRERFLAAQEISLRTCESCGLPKSPCEQGLTVTFCETCQLDYANFSMGTSVLSSAPGSTELRHHELILVMLLSRSI